MDDFLKAFLGVALAGIFAMLGWMATSINESSVGIAEMNGKIALTNVHIQFLQKEISGLPKKEDLVLVESTVKSLEKRILALEGWVAVKTITAPKAL